MRLTRMGIIALLLVTLVSTGACSSTAEREPTPTSTLIPTSSPTSTPIPTSTSTPSYTYSYHWITGTWGTCSATCGGGMQLRQVFCIRTDINDVSITVPDMLCPESKPLYTQACNTQACPTPTSTPEPTTQVPTHE